MNTKDPVQVTIEGYSNSAKIYKDLRSDLSIDEDNRRYFLDHLPGKKILDIGCAHGRDVCEFFKNGKEVFGIDLTPEFVAMAKESCPEAKIQLMDMRKLDFNDHSFDGLWVCASLLHIPKNEVDKTLEGFHRILKKGGLLFICVKEGIGEDFDEWDRFFSYRRQEEIQIALNKHKFSIQKLFINGSKEKSWINIFAIAE